MDRKEARTHIQTFKETFESLPHTPCDWETLNRLLLVERQIYHKELDVDEQAWYAVLYDLVAETLKNHLNTMEYFLTQRSITIMQSIDRETVDPDTLMPYYLTFARFMKRWYLLEINAKENSEEVLKTFEELIPSFQSYLATMESLQEQIMKHYDKKLESQDKEKGVEHESSIFN